MSPFAVSSSHFIPIPILRVACAEIHDTHLMVHQRCDPLLNSLPVSQNVSHVGVSSLCGCGAALVSGGS